MLVDDIPARPAFSSPFPYLLFAISWFFALPVYAATHNWHCNMLARLLLLATGGAAPFAAYAIHYFLTPRDIFAATLIVTTAWAGTLTFWSFLRLFGPEHENARPA